ncbi:MAG TPA: hypothetical protein DCS93_37620 [Microscillaceae bacterium]|nr:hypothetical protein [Microscillaceae bacterium]
MKKLLLLFTLSTLALSLLACEGIESSFVPWASSAPKTVKIYMHNAAVTIEGYNGNKVKVEALGDYAPENDERAKGLTSLSNLGPDNTGKGVFLKEENDEVILSKVTRRHVDYRIKVPQSTKVILEETTWTGGRPYEITGVNGGVEVYTKTSSMHFKNVNGAIKARSTSGSAQLVFDRFESGNHHDISLISGSIDITLPKSAKTDLVMKTVSGEIFTDFEFPQDNGTFSNTYVGANVRKSLNGGGATTRLKTVSSNIYLRKKK